jgi:hypothetical protein
MAAATGHDKNVQRLGRISAGDRRNSEREKCSEDKARFHFRKMLDGSLESGKPKRSEPARSFAGVPVTVWEVRNAGQPSAFWGCEFFLP